MSKKDSIVINIKESFPAAFAEVPIGEYSNYKDAELRAIKFVKHISSPFLSQNKLKFQQFTVYFSITMLIAKLLELKNFGILGQNVEINTFFFAIFSVLVAMAYLSFMLKAFIDKKIHNILRDSGIKIFSEMKEELEIERKVRRVQMRICIDIIERLHTTILEYHEQLPKYCMTEPDDANGKKELDINISEIIIDNKLEWRVSGFLHKKKTIEIMIENYLADTKNKTGEVNEKDRNIEILEEELKELHKDIKETISRSDQFFSDTFTSVHKMKTLVSMGRLYVLIEILIPSVLAIGVVMYVNLASLVLH